MTYRRLVILMMMVIMAFPLFYNAVCHHDKVVYSIISDEEKPGHGEDGGKDCKDDVTKWCQDFFTYTIGDNSAWNNRLLPLGNSVIPTVHFAKVPSPPPDTI